MSGTPWTVFERLPDGGRCQVVSVDKEHVADWYAEKHGPGLFVEFTGKETEPTLFEIEGEPNV